MSWYNDNGYKNTRVAMSRLYLVKLIFTAALIFALQPSSVLASELNVFTVPITEQSRANIHSDLGKAFLGVLIKISGNEDIASVKGVKEALPNVEKFVQQYSYTDTGLEVIFNTTKLTAFLGQLGQPIWNNPRPNTLLWITTSSGALPMSESTLPALTSAFKASAEQRGIQLIFPQINSLESSDTKDLLKIAENYQCPALLSGELTEQSDQTVVIKWSFIWNGQTWQWQDAGVSASASITAGVNKIADLMAKQLASNPDLQAVHNTWLAIMDISSLESYQNMLQELYKLNLIVAISTKEVGSQGVLLQITTHADSDALKSALDKDAHFAVIQQTSSQPVLHYRWVP